MKGPEMSSNILPIFYKYYIVVLFKYCTNIEHTGCPTKKFTTFQNFARKFMSKFRGIRCTRKYIGKFGLIPPKIKNYVPKELSDCDLQFFIKLPATV